MRDRVFHSLLPDMIFEVVETVGILGKSTDMEAHLVTIRNHCSVSYLELLPFQIGSPSPWYSSEDCVICVVDTA